MIGMKSQDFCLQDTWSISNREQVNSVCFTNAHPLAWWAIYIGENFTDKELDWEMCGNEILFIFWYVVSEGDVGGH